MASSLFNSAHHVGKTVELGVHLGLDRGELLAAAGLPSDFVFDPDGHLPFHSSQKILGFILRKLGDPAIPIRFAAHYDTEDFQALGFASVTSRDVREGITRSIRYSRLLTNSGRFQMVEAPSVVTITWVRDLPLTLSVRIGNEIAVAQFLQLGRIGTASAIRPLLVTFQHSPPPSIEAHEEFFGCEVLFDSESNSLHLDSKLLDRPMVGADDALASFFERYLNHSLGSSPRARSLVERVRATVLADLSEGVPTSERVARELGLSDRSLRRHLKGEGTTYRDLVRSIRLQTARALLQDSRNTIAEIAFLLGYSDAGAFSRAFRRDVGQPPKAFRAK